MTVFCQLHEAGGLSYVSYMRQYDGYLSVIIDRLEVICQLHEAALSLYDCYLSVVRGRMTGICQLYEASLSLYVSKMRQVRRYLSVT